MGKKIIYFVLSLCLKEVLVLDPCEEHNNCNECIQDSISCVWCASNDYNGTKRCKSETSDQKWCPGSSLQNPINFKLKYQDRNFSSESGAVTQIKPQIYQMKLRPGQPMDFSFSFKGARNYPVDLYFLFDASLSMISTKNHTAQNSEKIYRTMLNMTNDVYLGMGSFIDKNTLPFALKVSDELAYSFRHRLNLTKDYYEFQEAVAATPVGENRDEPEGGLDALAQAIVCKEQIGWRNESRKILILLTNGPYHAAGDGKSGGIFKPYDGKCYTENGVYTKELEMDYPSVSMINKLAKQNKIIILFAVTYNLETVYRILAGAISGAKMDTLDVNKEDGIVTTLKKIYKEITKKIKLNVNMRNGRLKNFDISFNPDCTREQTGKNCDVDNEKEHSFNGTIKLKEYDGNDDPILDISVEGINETLTLEMKILKDCECASKAESNSTYCNGEKRECGACICSERKYGDKCACNRITSKDTTINDDSATSTKDLQSACIGEGMTKPCNGTGTCTCGVCTCDVGYKGRYCDCNIQNCPRDALGKPCGGHGVCQCNGSCICADGYSGNVCDCPDSKETCKGKNDTICNNRGLCKCGSCNCDVIADWDSRKYQSTMCVVTPCRGSECHELQCTKLNNCVLCRMNDSPNCPCESAEYELLDKLPEDIANSTDWNVCPKLRVSAGCYTNYAYKYDEDEYRILVKLQREKDCAKIYYWTGGIFLLTLLLVGIFTLVAWKLCTDYRDRQEYLAFLNDHKDISEACENPLYEPATTTFKNPAFRKRSVN